MKAAVICSKGMGDGLMMMTASHRLKMEGYEVTTFQDLMGELTHWFPGQYFEKRSTIRTLDAFDFILLQNDNTPFSFDLIDRYRKKMHLFYASYEPKKHRPLTAEDVVFNRSEPLVKNIAEGIAHLLKLDHPLYENGITPPKDLIYRKHQKRVVIHPTSTTPKRSWAAEKFIALAHLLEDKGWEPVFSVGPSERNEWEARVNGLYPLPFFPHLSALAAYLYESYFLIGNESGTGHLASNLGIPTLIVASCPKQMALWRPGFLLGQVVTPPPYVPNFKFLRLREKKWQSFISPKLILKAYQKGC